MKIAYVNVDPDAPVFGRLGCSVHMQEVLRAMLEFGIEVHLFASRIGDDAIYDLSQLRVHPLPRSANYAEQSALAINRVLRSALEHESQSGQFDLIYERFSLYSYAGMEFSREFQIPGVLEVNAPLLQEHAARGTLNEPMAAEEAATKAFRAASLITAVSRQLAGIIEQHPTARGRVRVVPNAVNPARFRDAPALNKDCFVIGYVGALRSTGGLTTLIEAFALVARDFPRARLLIIGDGPVREHLQREIAARNLVGRVIFAGEVSPAAMPGLLASMDVAVASYPPLSTFYSSPLKLYEYMAAGLPLVASRIGQVEEVIRDGLTGLLVTPGHAPELAKALRELAGDPIKRTQLGEAARAAVQEHTWEHQVAAVLSQAGMNLELLLQ